MEYPHRAATFFNLLHALSFLCCIFVPKFLANIKMNILLLIGGLVLILLGANALTDGAASLAKRFGISELVIGLTIVAFGTSAPELTVSVASALNGSADMAVGNVVGSNLFNTLMIVGCTALFAPIIITRGTLLKEIPLCILASVVLYICASDHLLNGSLLNRIDTSDGLILLCFFLIFMSYTFAIAHKPATDEGEEKKESAEIRHMPLWQSALYIVGGLTALVLGGKGFVSGASGIARGLGVSEAIIGLTIVAGGTSLPELATSIVAALKKNSEIAIGNVVGSNLFNIFFVLGCSATVTPLSLQGITQVDLLVLIAAGILLWLFGVFFGKRTITRIEGSILALAYVAYTAYLIWQINA